MGTSQWKQQAAAGIPRDGLWCISLCEVKIREEVRPGKPGEDQQRSSASHGVAMQELPLSVCGVVFDFFLNITELVKCLFSAKHHMPSQVFSSKQLPETARDTTELLKRPEISTSHSLRFSQ